ncbi:MULTISPECIES: L-arabinose isomerase [unclassified Agarivorans]|uniref:L-arabinose isomerase n=1 Tax=unclassified Agarivorans TaxID=2636026 RepID=UPI003D7CA598
MTNSTLSLWFVTGSQHLYGPKVLEEVANDSNQLVQGLNDSGEISLNIVDQGVVTDAAEISRLMRRANSDESCAGIMLWMHTFSPAKMWIAGLGQLNKPMLHLHTQFNANLPWQSIDMNFMNTNQSAHGGREFGFVVTRMNVPRKVVVGHWQEPRVLEEVDQWARATRGVYESESLKVARFGDNMRQVAVTDGNKVSAQIKFGYEVNAYGVGDLKVYVDKVSDDDCASLIDEYCASYVVDQALLSDPESYQLLVNEARLEIGMERFLSDHGCMAFTNCFEDLHGLTNLPGLATQRLMAKGYGYGGEGDWKTAALVRIVKAMTEGEAGGTSFMEDYTYDFGAVDQVLGAHMLEVCPSISENKPELIIARHTIGCKCDIPRLKFSAKAGPAINLSLIDLGDRFRLIANAVDTVDLPEDMPNLPVAHALWQPQPNLPVAAASWIHAGGAHHSVYTQALSMETVIDYAQMHDIELIIIDNSTDVRSLQMELRHNNLHYRLNSLG